MDEIWVPISGTNNLYFVSNFGRVKSFVRGKERLLKPNENNKGYYRVTISVPQKRVVFVHRLVAEYFVEHKDGCTVVNHKDFNPKNNNFTNLEWTTMKGNSQYSLLAGRFSRTSEWIKNLKESLDRVQGKPVIGINLSTGKVIQYAALNDCKRDGFQPSCVSNCCNGKRNSHKGFVWRFQRNAPANKVNQYLPVREKACL